MRVAIANLTNGGLSGGYRKYLSELVPSLAAHPVVDDLVVLVPENTHTANWGQVDVLTIRPSEHRRGFRDSVNRVLARKPDVVLIPTARWRRFGNLPVVSMIRNMEPLLVPCDGNAPRECLKNLGRARVAKRAACRANRVIAVSEAVRSHITSRWRLDSDRVGVVHHGVHIPTHARKLSDPPQRLDTLQAENFLFTAGSIRPARGLEDAIRALGFLKRGGPTLKLAIAGHLDTKDRFARDLMSLVDNHELTEDVTWLGELNQAEMAWCFDNCKAFLMTSRAEACPNILLEAMVHGCLCLVTNLDVMLELLGPEALAYSAKDWAALAALVEQANSWSADVSAIYREDARERARLFTWERTARRTLEELTLALNSS